MAGTIVTDRIESDASYASSINIASPMVVSNTLTMGSAAAITGNVNIDSGLLFVDSVGNRVGIGTASPTSDGVLDVVGSGTTFARLRSSAGSAVALFFQNSDTGTTSGDGFYVGVDSAEKGLIWNTENTDLRIATNNTERINIDASGRVTMPAQPSFQAYLTTSWNLSNGTTVPFNATSWNIGSHYNTSNYRFTAPVAGIYAFYTHSYTSVSSGTVRAMHFQFRVNGTLRLDSTNGGFSPDGGYSYHPAQNNFVTIQLSVNDYVDFYLNGGDYGSGTNFNGGSAYTVFGGYLIG